MATLHSDRWGTSEQSRLTRLFGKEVQVLSGEPAPEAIDAGLESLDRDEALRRLTALYEIGRTLSATLDLREIFGVIWHAVAQGMLGASHLIVALFDQENRSIRCGFAVIDGVEIDPDRFPFVPLGRGPVSETIRTREPRLVDLREVHPELHVRAPCQSEGQAPQSALYLPLISGDRVIGVVHLQHPEAEAFHESDLPLLTTLANQAAAALANAQLYALEQERTQEMTLALEKHKELQRMHKEVLQTVSRELRTPLGIVHGYVELLDSGELGELQPEHRELTRIVAERVRTLCDIVEDFDTLLHRIRAPAQPVHLALLAGMVYEQYQIPAGQAGLALTLEQDPLLPPVLGHPTQLQQMVEQLVDNGIKFTPAGGSVTLRLRSEGSAVVVEVSDTGVGIPHNRHAHIFERFFQSASVASRPARPARPGGGAGLGLALVKEIVEAHGGQIAVDSTPGRGSTFRVRLPAA